MNNRPVTKHFSFPGKKLKNRIFLILTGFFISLAVLSALQIYYVKNLKAASQSVSRATEHYNQILAGTNEISEAVDSFTYGYAAYEEIEEMCSALTENAEAFARIMSTDQFDRPSFDLMQLTITYGESTERRLLYFEQGKYDACTKEADNFREIKSFIIRKFAEADTSLRLYQKSILERNERLSTIQRRVTFSVGLVMTVLFIYLAWLLFHRFLVPVDRISTAVRQYHSGTDYDRLHGELNFTQQDEIGTLAGDILEMLRQLEERARIEQQKLHAEQMAKEAQLKFMQARINPHFLFNSLNMIGETAYLEEADQTSELLEALGSFLRYNLDQFSKVVTLRDELENLEAYLVIQRKRMGKRIDFSVDAQQEAQDIRVPCLILQPLVENAVMHGVGSLKSGGRVRVTVTCMHGEPAGRKAGGQTEDASESAASEDRVCICVSDNGKGMTPEKLEQVRQIVNMAGGSPAPAVDAGDGRDHIGIRNVFGRLRLYFGERLKIEVESDPGECTYFKFFIPREVRDVQNGRGG